MLKTKKLSELNKKKHLPDGWKVVPSKTYPDRVYYYNVKTGSSTWKNPCLISETNKISSSNSSAKYAKNNNKVSKLKILKRKKIKLKNNEKSSDSSNHLNLDSTKSKEIEDYDEEQDSYFDSALFCSNFSNMSSTNSLLLSKSNLTNSVSSTSNSLLENFSKKHFSSDCVSSSSKKRKKRKSTIISDLERPSTSINVSKIETNIENTKKEDTDLLLNKPSISSDTKISSDNISRKDILKSSFCRNLASQDSEKNTTKTVKSILLSNSIKTPAQERLLKFKEKYLKSVDEHAKEFSEINLKNGSDVKSVQQFSNKSSNFLNKSSKDAKDFSQDISHRTNTDPFSYVEEMDWEPSNVELVVQNINVLRQQQNKTREVSGDILIEELAENSKMLPSKLNSCVFVLDTNILISCLSFLMGLRDTNISGLGYPVFYIPWTVMQELDNLKGFKTDTVKKLVINVKKAISYLNENFKSKHPRCLGQSFEDFKKVIQNEVFAPDDEILQTCMWLKKLPNIKKLILLTNDKNLESKAIINVVEVYSKESFQKKYLSSNNKIVVEQPTSDVLEADEYICELKSILKWFITLVVETELIMAFGDDWRKIAYKKPPWTLQEAMDCFIKHWVSVFHFSFSHSILKDFETLYKMLFKAEPGTIESVQEVFSKSYKIVSCIKNSPASNRYKEVIDVTLLRLSRNLKKLSPKVFSQVSVSSSVQTPLYSKSRSEKNEFLNISKDIPRREYPTDDIDHIKNVFEYVGNFLRSFCYTIQELINSCAVNNNISNEHLPEARLKLRQVINDVGVLVIFVEKIFEINIDDINENHSVITHLSDFLTKNVPSIPPEVREKLAVYLASFCSRLEGRILLNSSLKDFKNFSEELIKAAKYLESNFRMN